LTILSTSAVPSDLVDFDPGPGQSRAGAGFADDDEPLTSGFVFKLGLDGSFRWVQVFGGTPIGAVGNVGAGVLAAGNNGARSGQRIDRHAVDPVPGRPSRLHFVSRYGFWFESARLRPSSERCRTQRVLDIWLWVSMMEGSALAAGRETIMVT